MRQIRQTIKKVGIPILTGLLVGACSIGSDSASSSPWSALAIGGAEVEIYETLDAMAQASDLVAIGSFDDFRVSRTIQGDAEEDVLVYIGATFTPATIITSTQLVDEVVVEFTDPRPNTDATLSQIEAAVGTEVMVFLRDKGGEEEGLYRLVNSAGMWEDRDGELIAPLHESFGPNDLDSADPFRPAIINDVTRRSTLEELASDLQG